MFSFHLKQPARWLLLAATLGTLSVFADNPTPAPVTLAQANPTVVISGPGGVPTGASLVAGNCSSVNTGLIQLTKAFPAEVGFGENFTYELRSAAVACVGNVVITDTIPDGASFVSAEPQAQVAGKQLTWNLGDLDAGASKVIRVTLKAEKEGTLTACATVKADPRVCAQTVVGRPQLAIEKTGPETAILGSDVAYNIVVRNVGTAVAKGVTVTDKVPAGLGGPREIPFTVGDLPPGGSRTIPVTLKAAERGRHCNVAVASAANAPSVEDDACTTVVKPGIKLVKTGTPEQILGRQADYKLVVSNTGDTTLENTIVTDTAPAQTRIVSAPGASVAGLTATWNVGTLRAGESKELALTLTSDQIGTWCNTAVATAAGLRESAEACTVWKGVAGVLVEFVDDPDPIPIGSQTVYTIRITNQGNADLINISTVAESDSEIDLVNSPQGTIDASKKKVTFPTVPRLGGRQSITYTFSGRAVSAGQAYQKAIVTVDGFRAPIEEYEATTTY